MVYICRTLTRLSPSDSISTKSDPEIHVMKLTFRLSILLCLVMAPCLAVVADDADDIALYKIGEDIGNLMDPPRPVLLTPGNYSAYIRTRRVRHHWIPGSGGSRDTWLYIIANGGLKASYKLVGASAVTDYGPASYQSSSSEASAASSGSWSGFCHGPEQDVLLGTGQAQANASIITNATRIIMHAGASTSAQSFCDTTLSSATAESTANCNFTIFSNYFAIVVPPVTRFTNTPPPCATNMPTVLPNTIEVAQETCDISPAYLWTSATSGKWFEIPQNAKRIQFTGTNGAYFSSISNFPCNASFVVEFGGVTNGPFVNGQQLDFTSYTNTGIDTFTLISIETNSNLSVQIQLTFTTPTADFKARPITPQLTSMLLERINDGSSFLGISSGIVPQGQTIRMSAITLGTCENLYQWKREGVSMISETNTSLTFSNVLSVQSGTYSVSISNETGMVENSLQLIVQLPQPRFLQPLILTNLFQAIITNLLAPSTLVVESSSDFVTWTPLATNVVTDSSFLFQSPLTMESALYRVLVR